MLVVAAVCSALAGAVSLLWFRWKKQSAPPALERRWNLAHLLIASFLVIFAELAIIRWISVEVRIFAYFKNLALLVCFLGFGMGCALARTQLRWKTAVLGMIALLGLVRLPLAQRTHVFEQLSAVLGGSAAHSFWATDPTLNLGQFLLGALMAAALLFLITTLFVPLGQIVSEQIALAPRTLPAYTWNLFASLLGVLAFLAASKMMLGPQVWMVIVLFGYAALQPDLRRAAQVACLVLPAIALLHETQNADRMVLWTPYQQIEVSRSHFADGERIADLIRVNHTGYQRTIDLRPAFIRRHEDYLGIEPGYSNFDIAYLFAPPNAKVLIVGAGTGNDIAAALRHGAADVDAVEIDPAIYRLGKETHPEHPYDSPRVHAYLTDARAFLRRTQNRYDLIVFAGLDSHTEFSDYSNMRLDNFVYTEQAITDAKAHLEPNGVVFLGFEVNRPWLGARLRGLLAKAFGKDPRVFTIMTRFLGESTCFVISPGTQVENALAADPKLAAIVQSQPAFLQHGPVPLTTDDWPYLYSERRSIPPTYYTVSILLLLIAFALFKQIPNARQQHPSLFFFAMGAGFMLLETQAISRLALFFGTTWVVNGIVISAVLVTLMISTVLADSVARHLSRTAIGTALLLSLLLAYAVPMEKLARSADVAGSLAAVFFALPVFFAGLLFAREFDGCADPRVALGSNMVGAVLGGLFENASFLWGMRSLLLIALAVYAIAVAAAHRRGLAVAAHETEFAAASAEN